jgi:deoxyribonuclease-4
MLSAMAAKYLGAHMPTGKGLGAAVRAGAAIACTAVQVFTSSPQQWRSRPVTDAMAADFALACSETGITHTVSHDSYLVNLAALDDEKQTMSVNALIEELQRCDRYGIPLVVSHIGAHMGAGEDAGRERAAHAIRRVLADSPSTVTLLMETTAGQGSSLNAHLEGLAAFRELVPDNRLGVCVDTCHLFAAGYDIRTDEGYDAFWVRFESLLGWAPLMAFHLNDSQKPLGSRVDRHAAIGEGLIGEACFRRLVNDPRFAEVPMVVETPDAETEHAVNVARLRSYFAA